MKTGRKALCCTRKSGASTSGWSVGQPFWDREVGIRVQAAAISIPLIHVHARKIACKACTYADNLTKWYRGAEGIRAKAAHRPLLLEYESRSHKLHYNLLQLQPSLAAAPHRSLSRACRRTTRRTLEGGPPAMDGGVRYHVSYHAAHLYKPGCHDRRLHCLCVTKILIYSQPVLPAGSTRLPTCLGERRERGLQ